MDTHAQLDFMNSLNRPKIQCTIAVLECVCDFSENERHNLTSVEIGVRDECVKIIREIDISLEGIIRNLVKSEMFDYEFEIFRENRNERKNNNRAN